MSSGDRVVAQARVLLPCSQTARAKKRKRAAERRPAISHQSFCASEYLRSVASAPMFRKRTTAELRCGRYRYLISTRARMRMGGGFRRAAYNRGVFAQSL